MLSLTLIGIGRGHRAPLSGQSRAGLLCGNRVSSYAARGFHLLGANGAVLVLMMSLMLGMACAAEVERFQEGDLKVLYNGLHCLNADGEHGELVQRVQQVARSPESMQVQSTNMDPVAKPTTMESSGGQLTLEEFSVVLDDGDNERLYHSVQMYYSAKSPANIIVGLTALAFIDHKTCQTTWIRLPEAGTSDFDLVWTRDEGWVDKYYEWLYE